jgi:hypothetical protein
MQTDTPSAIALLEQVDQELRVDPTWYRQFDDLDPFQSPLEVVEQLRATAPTRFAKGFLSGILVMRQGREAEGVVMGGITVPQSKAAS